MTPRAKVAFAGAMIAIIDGLTGYSIAIGRWNVAMLIAAVTLTVGLVWAIVYLVRLW